MRNLLWLCFILLCASCSKYEKWRNQRLLQELGLEHLAGMTVDIDSCERYKACENCTIVYENRVKAVYDKWWNPSLEDSIYGKGLFDPNSFIEDTYTYFLDGSIKSYSQYFMIPGRSIGFYINKRIEFAPNGMIARVYDYELPYKFSINDVLAWVEANDIDLWDKHTCITKWFGEEDHELVFGYCWSVKTEDRKSYTQRRIILDPTTGEVLTDVTIAYDESIPEYAEKKNQDYSARIYSSMRYECPELVVCLIPSKKTIKRGKR